VAADLGVSTATVSNAFNRPERVSDELRARVLGHARAVGYAGPDPAARQLRRGRSDVVGLVFTDDLAFAIDDPASVGFLSGVAEVCGAAGRNLLLLAGGPPTDVLRSSPVSSAAIDALIVYSVPDSDRHLRAGVERGVPVVVVDQPREQPTVDWVGLDDRAAARDLAGHVAGLGHRRIGIICTRLAENRYNGPVSAERRAVATYAVQRERLAGFFEGLLAAGVDEESVTVEERFLDSRDSGAEALAALLLRRPDVTAVCCLADVLALGVMDAAQQRGLRVPADLTVTGFDDIPEAQRVGLTTVQQPLARKGREAARLVLERLAAADQPGRGDRRQRRVVLPTVIQIRTSSGPANRAEPSRPEP
jgi:DNA-binding LacI/PurR family transcriptional regulator